MKYLFFLFAVLSGHHVLHAQHVFFKSNQTFTEKTLETFYSSIALQGNLLLFNANDYELYAYNKNTGTLQWQQRLNWKSDVAPFFAQGYVWANGNNEVLQLDTATGKVKKATVIVRMDTQPTIIDGVLYSTGIYDAGCLFAYDLKHDSMLWSRFIAHGIAQTPFYLPNKIITNAEGNHWIEVGYKGNLLDTLCEKEEVGYPSELSCAKSFLLRTHDGKEITGKLATKLDENDNGLEQVFYTPEKTFVINDDKLFVIGNKGKLQLEKSLDALADGLETVYNDEVKILKGDKQTIWLHLGNHILHYNFAKKKALRSINLESWAPHQVLLDDSKIWLISSNDGLLYGLNMD